MATHVLMPLSPTEVSPSASRQMTGKYFRSTQKSSSGKGSTSLLTRKGLSQSGRPLRESKEKDSTCTEGITQEDIDPQSYRNTLLHNICVQMLEEGFHKSFSELFQLIEQQRQDHIRAGPAAILLEPLIENDATKLDQLKAQLTAGEACLRGGDMAGVYMAQRRLAAFFELTKDTWLSDHFYHRCLETGKMVEGDSHRMEGEAHCHVGLALENRGQLETASGHIEIFHALARKHKWFTDNGEELHKIACEHLRRMYTKIAEQVHAASTREAISYLKKAHEVVREGGDAYQEGLASYRLGNAHESIGEHDTAIKYHKGYLERCKHCGDNAGVGSAYEALSLSFESKGDTENAVKFLEMFVEVSEVSGLASSLAKACSAIGIMHNTLGNYERAVEYFDRCYKICTELGDTDALHVARAHYGVAKSHQLMGRYTTCVQDTLQELVLWKDTRVQPSDNTRVQPSDNTRVDTTHS